VILGQAQDSPSDGRRYELSTRGYAVPKTGTGTGIGIGIVGK
jgi:hypothetical protein